MMRLIARILALPLVVRLIKRLAQEPYGHIYGANGSLYMGRWSLVRESRFVPFSIRLHWIVRPDEDRHLHDHPFSYRTFVLEGHYVEETLNHARHVLFRGDTRYSPQGRYHRIAVVPESGALTLFVMGRNNDDWGFMVSGEKIDRRKYKAA